MSHKVWKPKTELTRLGPQMSEWSISKAEVALLFILLGNEGQVCLPRCQDTHFEKIN